MHQLDHPRMPLIVGEAYGPKEVAEVYGGDFQSFMHIVDGRIARCFVHASANPEAPARLFVGRARGDNADHPSKAMPRATRLMREGGPILLFIRREAGARAIFHGTFVPVLLRCSSEWGVAHPDGPVHVDDVEVERAGRCSVDLRGGGTRSLSGVLELAPTGI